jgi:hypothetical protein
MTASNYHQEDEEENTGTDTDTDTEPLLQENGLPFSTAG